jgi:hypothetical protein
VNSSPSQLLRVLVCWAQAMKLGAKAGFNRNDGPWLPHVMEETQGAGVQASSPSCPACTSQLRRPVSICICGLV